MMTHVICRECWDLKSPGQSPVRPREGTPLHCCYCGKLTKDVIYTWEDGEKLLCHRGDVSKEG